MNRLLPRLALAALAMPVAAPALSQPALLALYQDRTDASYRLHDIIGNTPLGVALTNCCQTVSGTLTFNPALREILLIQHTDTGQEIVRISAISGAVTGRAAIGGGWQILAAAYDRTRATLFGIGRDNAGDRHLVTVASNSGAVTAVGAALPSGFALVPGGHGLHPRRGQWHLLGSDDGTTQRVLTVALDNGALLSNVPVVGYAISNLSFDEGSGRLLGLGRAVGNSQTQLLWFDPGTGQVTGLTASGTNGCCAWGVGSLAGIAGNGTVGSQYTVASGTPMFLAWFADSGNVAGSIPQSANWAVHGLVVDQTTFIGDHLFYDGFQIVGKPTGGELPFE